MGNSGSQAYSSSIGIIVGFAILAVLFTIGLVQFFCKHKCKNMCKNLCKKKKPSLKDKMLTKVGLKKSPPPFTISGNMK